MPDELVDVCDENNNLLNIQKMISEVHKDGLWHRCSYVWIYNSNREILLQLRAKDKFLFPNVWDASVAGHVAAGESPIVSGLRETEEEIGLKLRKEDLDFWTIKKHKTTFRDIKNNEFAYVYFFKFDGDINQLKLQKEEVQKVQFFSIDKIKEELKSNPEKYVPHGDYWFEVLDDIERRIAS